MVASQMAAALFDTTAVDIEAKEPQVDKTLREGKVYMLKATGSVLHFPGFLTLYSEGKDEAEEEEKDKAPLPPLAEGERLRLIDLFPQQHFTQPPPCYNEATLVKALEERGIGRPSTYAPIIFTLRQRGYVERKDGRFHPLDLGFIVNDLLVEHFPQIVDIGFTAQMEEQLDEIARGERGWVGTIQEFYIPFEETLKKASTNIVKVKEADQPTDELCPQCGRSMVIRMGRYGRFLACSGYPKCKTTKPLTVKE
jgi:DNA topoisomerase-1